MGFHNTLLMICYEICIASTNKKTSEVVRELLRLRFTLEHIEKAEVVHFFAFSQIRS